MIAGLGDSGVLTAIRLARQFDVVGISTKPALVSGQELGIRLEVVKRSDDVSGFQVLPRRWVVERTLGWLTRCRRLCRDYERTIAHAEDVLPFPALRPEVF